MHSTLVTNTMNLVDKEVRGKTANGSVTQCVHIPHRLQIPTRATPCLGVTCNYTQCVEYRTFIGAENSATLLVTCDPLFRGHM